MEKYVLKKLAKKYYKYWIKYYGKIFFYDNDLVRYIERYDYIIIPNINKIVNAFLDNYFSKYVTKHINLHNTVNEELKIIHDKLMSLDRNGKRKKVHKIIQYTFEFQNEYNKSVQNGYLIPLIKCGLPKDVCKVIVGYSFYKK
jgi:hypothetical protein